MPIDTMAASVSWSRISMAIARLTEMDAVIAYLQSLGTQTRAAWSVAGEGQEMSYDTLVIGQDPGADLDDGNFRHRHHPHLQSAPPRRYEHAARSILNEDGPEGEA
ncbi:MAG: hypothetical protein U1E41_04900 [Paracoccus sp. (in: a-proteobacteria)]